MFPRHWHCCGDQLTVAGETETSAIWFPFKWKYWQGLVCLPRYVSRSPLAIVLTSSGAQQKPATPPADIQRQSHGGDPSFRCCQSLKDCVLKGVRGVNDQINRTHSQFRRQQLFHLYLPEKMVIYLLHMSAWTLNVH